MPSFLSNLASRSTGKRVFKAILLDLALKSLYLCSNPFRICRRFLQKSGEKNIYAYGETPLAVWSEIAALAELKPDDLFCDFGCGRGRLCFWTATTIGCKTIGIDLVPAFILRASLLSFLFRLKNLQFRCARMTDIPLKQVTVLYLYTFHRDEEELDFSKLPIGARVISVSEPLPHSCLRVKTSMQIAFPWGKTEVFIHYV